MAKGIIARKLGMTQVFDKEGKMIPATILEAGPCTVTQVKTAETDKYDAVQYGFDPIREKLITNPRLQHLKKNNLQPFRYLREFRNVGVSQEVGQVIRADIFQEGEVVKVSGVSKGKGFQGVMKRHGFHGGRASHGSHFHRAPGSLSASSNPSRVFKGKKLPGHHGCKNMTILNLKVLSVDAEKNLLLVKGAVPGPRTALVMVEAL